MHAILLRPSMSRLRINWSLTLAHKAREVAIASKPTVLHAKVSGYTTNFVRDVGGASVRLNMLHAPLPMGGWLVGVRATNWHEHAFLPAIGGAPGSPDILDGKRHGHLDAMVLANPEDGNTVSFLDDDALQRWLPMDQAIEIAPIWQCDDFFNLREQFDAADLDGNGTIDAHELGELLRRETGEAPSDEEVASLIEAADENGDGLINFEEWKGTTLFNTRMRDRLHRLADRAAGRVQVLHDGAPWRGKLDAKVEAGGYASLVGGTALEL